MKSCYRKCSLLTIECFKNKSKSYLKNTFSTNFAVLNLIITTVPSRCLPEISNRTDHPYFRQLGKRLNKHVVINAILYLISTLCSILMLHVIQY